MRGFSTFLFNKKFARKSFRGYYLVQVGHFQKVKLGPDKNPYLDKIITPQQGILSFFAVQNELTLSSFTELFEHQPKFAPKWAPQNDIFSHLQTQVIKKRFVATPNLTNNWCFISCLKNVDVDQKTQLKTREKQR